VAPAPESTAEASPETSTDPGTETSAEPVPETAPEPLPATPAETAANAELEAKRLARQRDREVRAIIRQLLDELIATYASDDRGIEIREIAGGYRIATKPEYHDAVRLFIKSLKPPLKLSLPALETLAVIAYKQPCTAPEVSEIRGVESGGVLGSLISRKLIATAGRKQVIGRPILYKTTKEFLLRFGLKNVAELPSMEEFEKMAALELGEGEPSPEEEPTTEPSLGSASELDENASEEPEGEPAAVIAPETPEAGTAVTAANEEPTAPAENQPTEIAASESAQNVSTPQISTGSLTIEAEPIPAEATPAAPPLTKQTETETFPNDR
jgi:segregation and condensation protein B